MPRRKRGRDKPRGRRRDRSQDLPRLNIRATRRIGQTRKEVTHDPRRAASPRWEQRREPFPEGRALEDIIVLDVIEGRHYLRVKRELEGAEEKDVAA